MLFFFSYASPSFAQIAKIQNSSPFPFDYNSQNCQIESIPIEVNRLNASLLMLNLL